jgi:AraC-like DNA-binding protein
METGKTNADFENLAALPEFARFSTILTRLTGVSMALHSPASQIHITYGEKIKNPLCRLIRASEKGISRCNVCDLRHNRKAGIQRKALLYKCHAGFFDMIIPIFVRGVHAASISSGQILAEPPSEEGFARMRKKLNWLQAEEAALRDAYFSAPYMPKEKVRHMMGLLEIFAVQLCENLRQIRELESRLERAEIRKAKEFVAARFPDPDLGLAGAAAHAGLSPAHFSHVFKQCTGMPFTRHVQRVRLDEAKRLLSRTEKSVSEICFACGFNSLSNFIRVFRVLERTTPGGFRAMAWKPAATAKHRPA